MTRILAFAAAALVAFPIAARGDQLPQRKAGLWESKSTAQDGQTIAKQCVGEGTDQLAQGAMGMKACAKNVVTKTAEGYATESECQVGPVTARGKGLVTGDFETFVRAETETTVIGVSGSSAPKPVKSVIEARRLGECEPGQKPGDVILSDGRVISMPPGGRQ